MGKDADKMKKATYSEEFEKFWTIWKRITGRWQGRHVAYRYWKRDRLDSRLDEILAALTNENKARKDSKARNIWMPEWCLASTWLNQKRYKDEPPERDEQEKTRNTQTEHERLKAQMAGWVHERTVAELLEHIKKWPNHKKVIEELRPEMKARLGQ